MKRSFWLILALTSALGCVHIDAGEGDEAGSGGTHEGGDAAGGAAAGGGSEGGGGANLGGGGHGGEGGGPACAPPADPKLFEIGTGESCFERITDGEVLPLVSGPQGGYHMWLSFGCQGCDAQLHVKWGVRDPDTGAPIPNTWDAEGFVDLAGSPFRQRAGITLGMPGISWDPESFPPLPEGTHVTMWAQLVDASGGVILEDARQVVVGETVVWDPCAETPEAPECQTG